MGMLRSLLWPNRNHETCLLQTVLVRKSHDRYKTMDGSADITLLGAVVRGDKRGLRGPSCSQDSIPVREGYRVGQMVSWLAQRDEQW